MSPTPNIAVVGAGMAGVVCARTLSQAGFRVSLFERSADPGGRMGTQHTVFGSFDLGAQYFTVRDPRFARALDTAPGTCKPWSANAVRVLDEQGRTTAMGLPGREAHWVAQPGMGALLDRWSQPLASTHSLLTGLEVTAVEPDRVNHGLWQLRTTARSDTQALGAQAVHAGFDAVVLALPHAIAQYLLEAPAPDMARALSGVEVAPCWTLTLAFPQALQPNLMSLGPQWNAARSTHHRIAWLARESSKPGRGPIERWTVQASAIWSQAHAHDDSGRVEAKLHKAFTEITGIRAQPSHSATHFWAQAQTLQPLGQSHLWNASQRLGVAGDWCLGHRVEDAFVSGLELALRVHAEWTHAGA